MADDLERQLKDLVPKRTGRLKNSIKSRVDTRGTSYVISITMEDYFAWLKERKNPPTLPSAKELSLARPPLPKMNSLGVLKDSDLSPRAKGILSRLDIKRAMKKIDRKALTTEIKKQLI